MHALTESPLGEGSLPPCPAPFNLARHVLAAGETTPDKIALQILGVTRAERWSYAALTAAVRGVGSGLLGLGLEPGARILLRLGNTVEFPLAFLGALAAGLVPVPTSAQLTAPEITRMAALIDPALVIAAPDLALPDHPAPVIEAARLTAWRTAPRCDWHMGEPDRLGYLVFTSGSSGQPRAVMHAHRAVWARRMMWRDWYGLTPDDRLLHAGAFNWTYTLGTGLLDPWAIGATALIPAAGTTPAQLPLLLRRFDATIFAAAPGIYRQMLKSAIPPLPRLRHGLSAGEKLPPAIRTAWQEATGTPIFEALGMSEISTYVSQAPHRPGTPEDTGYPQTGRRVAVLDAEGRPQPPDTPGELAVGAEDPGLFLGYWGDVPADPARGTQTHPRTVGGWFRTGDIARMAADGAVRYLGRRDDMMNAGGFRVSPLEVEGAFAGCAGVADCAAAELPVREGVTVIALAYVPADPPPTEDALSAHAAANLARYKQPRLFVPRDRLPRGTNGKLDRRTLRRELIAERPLA